MPFWDSWISQMFFSCQFFWPTFRICFLISVHDTFLIGGFYFIKTIFHIIHPSLSIKWPFSCSQICLKNVKVTKYQQVYGRCAGVEDLISVYELLSSSD